MDRGTGCVLTPEPLGAVNAEPVLGSSEIPESFIVPAFRHWFDENFTPLPEKVGTLADGSELIIDQGMIDACVGFAFAVQKSSVEGKVISPRDTWAVTKALDAERGHPKEAYGATAWAGADALVSGVADNAVVDGTPAGMSRMSYMSVMADAAVRASRKANRGERAYFVGRDSIVRALWETRHPVPTSCIWYGRDNDIGRNGNPPTMTMPEGTNRGGHMFATIGKIIYGGKECLVVINSWSKAWGWHGMFLIPLESSFVRLGNGYIHVDKDTASLAELLARYDQKDLALAGTPDLYRCEHGVLKKYPNEIVWWSHGKAFGVNTLEISQSDFDVIPKGPDMELGYLKETIRQIRQSVGLS